MESNRAQGKRTLMMNYNIKEEEEYEDDEEQEEQEEEEEDEEDLRSSVYGEDGSRSKRVIIVNNSTTTTTPPPSPSKRGSGAGGSTARPCCQADTCNADLSDAKQYYRRHKVCDFHSKAPAVVVTGLRQRFCQQCSRFHNLSEFDGTKRSCRRRLAGHNERRRKSSSADYHGEVSSG